MFPVINIFALPTKSYIYITTICFKIFFNLWLLFLQMLEFYEKYDEIEEVLKKYVERNPRHVNAYIYICVHLHKHPNFSDPNSFIHYAEVCFIYLLLTFNLMFSRREKNKKDLLILKIKKVV